MKKALLSVLIVSIAVLASYAATRLPYGYGEAKWGMDQGEVQNRMDVFPFGSALSRNPQFSTVFATYTDDKERANITYYFYNERLFMVELGIKKSGKDMLKDLRYKYGRPIQFRKLFMDKDALYYETVWQDKSSRLILQESQKKKTADWKVRLFYSQNELMDEMQDIITGKIFYIRIKTNIKSTK